MKANKFDNIAKAIGAIVFIAAYAALCAVAGPKALLPLIAFAPLAPLAIANI